MYPPVLVPPRPRFGGSNAADLANALFLISRIRTLRNFKVVSYVFISPEDQTLPISHPSLATKVCVSSMPKSWRKRF